MNHPKAGKHGGWWHSAERRAMRGASWCRQLERPNPCTGKIYIHGKDVKGGLGQLASTGIQSLSSQLSSCMFMLRLRFVIDVVTTSFIFRKIARKLALTVPLFYTLIIIYLYIYIVITYLFIVNVCNVL